MFDSLKESLDSFRSDVEEEAEIEADGEPADETDRERSPASAGETEDDAGDDGP
ncbi:MAG: hypothetical protein V5A37_04735 [Halobacteriales archaeon]